MPKRKLAEMQNDVEEAQALSQKDLVRILNDLYTRHKYQPACDRFFSTLNNLPLAARAKTLISMMNLKTTASLHMPQDTLDLIIAAYCRSRPNTGQECLNMPDENGLLPIWHVVQNDRTETLAVMVDTNNIQRVNGKIILGHRNNQPIFLAEELFLRTTHLPEEDVIAVGKIIFYEMDQEELKHFASFLVHTNFGQADNYDLALMRMFIERKFNLLETFTVQGQQIMFVQHYCDNANSVRMILIKGMHLTAATMRNARNWQRSVAPNLHKNHDQFFILYRKIRSGEDITVQDFENIPYRQLEDIMSWTFEEHEPILNLIIQRQQNTAAILKYINQNAKKEEKQRVLEMVAAKGHVDTLKDYIATVQLSYGDYGEFLFTETDCEAALKVATDARRYKHAVVILMELMERPDYPLTRLPTDLQNLKLWTIGLTNTTVLKALTQILLDLLDKTTLSADQMQTAMEVLQTCSKDCHDIETLQRIVDKTEKHGSLEFHYDICERFIKNNLSTARDALAKKIAILECLLCRYDSDSEPEKQYRDKYRAELLQCTNDYMCVSDDVVRPSIYIAIDSIQDPALRAQVQNNVREAIATGEPMLLALMKAYNNGVVAPNASQARSSLHPSIANSD